MRRKQLVAVGILSICLFASGCGSNTVSTEQGTENTVIVQETEMQETEIKEVETQEVETQETESQDVETQTPETEEIVQITGEIYQLRDTVEIRQAYMGYNMESPRVPGDADLVIEEMSDNIIRGNVSINVSDVPDTNWIFYDWIKCSLLDENFKVVEDTMGYNVAKSYDGYDNGAFQHGDNCEIAFRVKNQDAVMYLKLTCESSEGDFDIFVELK